MRASLRPRRWGVNLQPDKKGQISTGLDSVSRLTFYELFTGKEDAFLHAHEEALADLTARVAAAAAPWSWSERMASAISAALLFAAEFPERGLLLAGGPLASGPWAAHAYDQLLLRFAPALSRGRRLSEEPKPPMLEEALLSGIAAAHRTPRTC